MLQNVDWVAGNGQRNPQFWASGPSFRECLGKMLLYRVETYIIKHFFEYMNITKSKTMDY